MFSSPIYKILQSAPIPLLCLMCKTISAIDIEAFTATIITGAFYTDQKSQEGVVSPWKLKINYKQELNAFTNIATQLSSQTGITSGAYIDGFNTQAESLKIENFKYTTTYSDIYQIRSGFGKVKANIFKDGGTVTPMPFSNAMARLPLKASDIAFAVKRAGANFNGSYTIGTAISDISSTTNVKRTYSLFLEAFKQTTTGNFWAQYSQNNLVKTFKSNHYFSFGVDSKKLNHITNASIYIGTEQGLIGYDLGYQLCNMEILKKNATLGLGYGYSKAAQSTFEVSLIRKLTPIIDATISWYRQFPKSKKAFNTAGIKLQHKF